MKTYLTLKKEKLTQTISPSTLNMIIMDASIMLLLLITVIKLLF